MKLVSTEHISEANAITHGGVFHADDVLATAILDCAMPDLVVCRVNCVPDGLPEGVIVFDVGGGAFDHHQRGGNSSRSNGIPYASAGLIWRAFGMRVVENSINPKKAWELVDRDLIQGVDAVDNGLFYDDVQCRQLTFSRIIGLMNSINDSHAAGFSGGFCGAVQIAKSVLECMLADIELKVTSEDAVERLIEESKSFILELPQNMPWEETLFNSKNDKSNELLFVVYPSTRGGYNWQCIPTAAFRRDQRFRVPRSWWGLSGAALRQATGVQDAVFCHSSGFLGVAESREGAFEMLHAAMRSASFIRD